MFELEKTKELSFQQKDGGDVPGKSAGKAITERKKIKPKKHVQKFNFKV